MAAKCAEIEAAMMKRLVEQEAASAAEVERKLTEVEKRLDEEKTEAAAAWVAAALEEEKAAFAERQKKEIEKVEKAFEERLWEFAEEKQRDLRRNGERAANERRKATEKAKRDERKRMEGVFTQREVHFLEEKKKLNSLCQYRRDIMEQVRDRLDVSVAERIQVEHRLKHTLESFRHYLHMSHGLHPEERTMDFMMELPLEIGRPTGVNTDEDVEGEEAEVEEPFVVRMVEGCAENWTFQDWKKVVPDPQTSTMETPMPPQLPEIHDDITLVTNSIASDLNTNQ